jgi:hypothetical protein
MSITELKTEPLILRGHRLTDFEEERGRLRFLAKALQSRQF